MQSCGDEGCEKAREVRGKGCQRGTNCEWWACKTGDVRWLLARFHKNPLKTNPLLREGRTCTNAGGCYVMRARRRRTRDCGDEGVMS